MTSTNLRPSGPEPSWKAAGLRYNRFGFFLKQKFGARVWKVSVDAGLGCPNRDGTISTGGCRFCNATSFSPSRRQRDDKGPRLRSIGEQLDLGMRNLKLRYPADHFLAYFQPETNTYGPVAQLEKLYREATEHPSIVGLAVGTRPDCVPTEVADLLAEMNRSTWVSVELGLQTIHNRTLDWLERGHRVEAFYEAFARLKKRGLHVGVHLIFGLPGETHADRLETIDRLATLGVDTVKFHHLYAVHGTRLADDYRAGRVELPARDEYVDWVVEAIQRLPAHCTIDRLSGDAPAEYLVAPDWSLKKGAVRAQIEAELQRRNLWQGSCLGQ